MPSYERFSRFLFGVLLMASCFMYAGRWVAFSIGALLLASSLYGLCISCKCKKLLNSISLNQEGGKNNE